MTTAAVPAGREGVAQNVITATGVARADIKTNGLWVVTNGVGNYTSPAAATTAQTRDRRQITLARNIIKNWLPAANGMLALTDAAVNVRMQVVLDALVRCITVNASVDDHYDTLLGRSHGSTALISWCTPGLSGITARTGTTALVVHFQRIPRTAAWFVPHHQSEPCRVAVGGQHRWNQPSERHYQHSSSRLVNSTG